jgi:WD40 repeat protein
MLLPSGSTVIKYFLPLMLALLLSGCAKTSDSAEELATLGLFSSTIDKQGKHLVIGSILHGASYWQIDPLKRLYNWNHAQGEFSQITQTALSGDGTRAATVTGAQWILWDTGSGDYLKFYEAGADIHAIALNENGDKALIGLEDGNVWYMDTNTGNNLAEMKHDGPVRSVAINANESLGLTGGDDYQAVFWDLKTGDPIHREALENMSRLVRFSPSGGLALISSLRAEHMLLNTNTFEVISNMKQRYSIYNDASFSNDEKHLFLASQEGLIQEFDTQTGKEISSFKAKRKSLFGGSRSLLSVYSAPSHILALSSDGQLFSFTP